MKLPKEIFDELIYELSKTPLVNEHEWRRRTDLVDAFKGIEARTSEFTNTILTHYSFRNPKLNKIFTDLTKRDINDAISLHTIEAYPPEGTVPHRDKYSYLTVNILIEDNFEGGQFYLNHKKYDGLREKGDYVFYNGNEEYHEVKPVTKGRRKSLVIWYGMEKSAI